MLPPPGRRPGSVPDDPQRPDPLPAPDEHGKLQPIPTAPKRKPRSKLALAPSPLMRRVTPADEAAFAALEAEVGGRAALVALLAAADLAPEESTIAGMLVDPVNDGVSLAKICIGGGIPLGRMLKVLQAAALAKGQTKAIVRVAAKLPDVADGVMDDAIGGLRQCDACSGLGLVTAEPTEQAPNPEPVKCKPCRGSGQVRYEPSNEVRKMALQIGGMLDKGGGAKIVVNQNQANFAAGGGADGYDGLMAALDTALYGAGRDRLRSARSSGQDRDIAIDGEYTE